MNILVEKRGDVVRQTCALWKPMAGSVNMFYPFRGIVLRNQDGRRRRCRGGRSWRAAGSVRTAQPWCPQQISRAPCSFSRYVMSRVEYLNSRVFPRAVADGAFGPGAAFESFEVDGGVAATDQFASDIVFGTVKLRRGGDPQQVVIKFKNADPVMSAMMNMHEKFYNEYVFYARLLPELARRAADPEAVYALFPRFLYSNATLEGDHGDGVGGGEQVIVVASVTPAGYRTSDQRVFLDVEHVLLALRKLGTLHGLSYNAKAHPDGRQTFVDLTAGLVETQWFDGYWYKSPRFLSGKHKRVLRSRGQVEGHRERVGRWGGGMTLNSSRQHGTSRPMGLSCMQYLLQMGWKWEKKSVLE